MQVVQTFLASMFIRCVLGGDDLSNLNVHIVAIVCVVGSWGLILGAQLFSLALNLVVLNCCGVLGRRHWGGGGVAPSGRVPKQDVKVKMRKIKYKDY